MKILIIEDNRRHQQDAREFFAQFPEVEIVICETYFPATRIMKSVDGIISDLFFPYDPQARRSGEERALMHLWLTHLVEEPDQRLTDPVGIRIMLEARAAKIPVLLNTSLYHHSSHLEWIHGMGWAMVDGLVKDAEGGPNVDEFVFGTPARHKDWSKAWKLLQQLIELRSKAP